MVGVPTGTKKKGQGQVELWEYAGTNILSSVNGKGYNRGLSILEGEAQESVTVQFDNKGCSVIGNYEHSHGS